MAELEHEMSTEELFEWSAYFKYKAEEEKRAHDKATQGAKRKR